MNPRNLGILAGVTVVVGALAAVAVYRERAVVAPRAETGLVLPALAAKVNDVSTIEVVSGEKRLTVHRDPAKADAVWTVKELGEYPAKFDKVKSALVGLSGLEKVEARTDQPESYEKIGVQAPAPGNTATLVKVSAAAGPAASLIVGKPKPAGEKQQVYVRVPEEKQSWLAEGGLAVTADPLDWVDRQVAQVDSTRIKSATVMQADGARLVVSRETKEAMYSVGGIPEGRALKTANAASPVAGGLAYLNFDGVKPASDVQFDPAKQVTAEYRTFDGLVVTVTTMEQEGVVWAKFAASFDESAVAPAKAAPVPEAPPGPDGKEPTEEEKASAQKKAQDDADAQRNRDTERVKKEVETLNGKWGPWVYQVPQAKADQFRRKVEDLLAEPAKEGAKPGEAGQPDGEPAPDDGPAPEDGDDGGLPMPEESEQPGNAPKGDDGGG